MNQTKKCLHFILYIYIFIYLSIYLFISLWVIACGGARAKPSPQCTALKPDLRPFQPKNCDVLCFSATVCCLRYQRVVINCDINMFFFYFVKRTNTILIVAMDQYLQIQFLGAEHPCTSYFDVHQSTRFSPITIYWFLKFIIMFSCGRNRQKKRVALWKQAAKVQVLQGQWNRKAPKRQIDTWCFFPTYGC